MTSDASRLASHDALTFGVFPYFSTVYEGLDTVMKNGFIPDGGLHDVIT